MWVGRFGTVTEYNLMSNHCVSVKWAMVEAKEILHNKPIRLRMSSIPVLHRQEFQNHERHREIPNLFKITKKTMTNTTKRDNNDQIASKT